MRAWFSNLLREGVGQARLADMHFPLSVKKDTFNRLVFTKVTTTAVRIEVEPVTKHSKSGEIGPPEAMFLNRDIDRREFGLIEWRIRQAPHDWSGRSDQCRRGRSTA